MIPQRPEERVPQTPAELDRQFKDVLDNLADSARGYDDGVKSRAKTMAAELRLLIHEGNGQSLLTQLNRKDGSWVDTSCDPPADHPPAYYCALIQHSPWDRDWFPNLDLISPTALNFKKWWEGVVLRTADRKLWCTRSETVLGLANQDGGAHVDHLKEFYAAFRRTNPFGALSFVIQGDKMPDTIDASQGVELGDPIPATARQIAHEVLLKFRPDYLTWKSPTPSGPILIGSPTLKIEPRQE